MLKEKDEKSNQDSQHKVMVVLVPKLGNRHICLVEATAAVGSSKSLKGLHFSIVIVCRFWNLLLLYVFLVCYQFC